MPSDRYRVETLDIVADGSGDALVYTPYGYGRVILIAYDGGLGATAALAITLEDSAVGVWTETVGDGAKLVFPTAPMSDQLGAALTLRDYIWCMGERVRIAVSGATASSTSTIRIAWAL